MLYARKLATIMTAEVWLVIETDELAPHELQAQGFEPTPTGMTLDQVKAKYGVREIVRVTNREIIVT